MTQEYNFQPKEARIMEFFYKKYELEKKREYFFIRDVYDGLNKSIPHISLRLLLVGLEEKGYIESIKIGRLNNYNRVFRLNVDPETAGGVWLVSRRSNSNN